MSVRRKISSRADRSRLSPRHARDRPAGLFAHRTYDGTYDDLNATYVSTEGGLGYPPKCGPGYPSGVVTRYVSRGQQVDVRNREDPTHCSSD